MKTSIAFLITILAIATTAAFAQTDDSSGNVVRAIFSSNIQDREPTDNIDTLNATAEKIFFFTELKNLQGQSIKHRWLFNGEQMAEINFDVGGDRWRVWSSKQLMPTWEGEWTVEVVDSSGGVLNSSKFTYEPAHEANKESNAETGTEAETPST